MGVEKRRDFDIAICPGELLFFRDDCGFQKHKSRKHLTYMHRQADFLSEKHAYFMGWDNLAVNEAVYDYQRGLVLGEAVHGGLKVSVHSGGAMTDGGLCVKSI